MSAPIDPNHFQVVDGGLTPQPWMQYRLVATESAPSVSGSYSPTTSNSASLTTAQSDVGQTVGSIYNNIGADLGTVSESILGTSLLGGTSEPVPSTIAGGVKNDLLYSLSARWTNDTPIDQWVYGLITRGGIRMTVQARTQAYILVLSGFAVGGDDASPVLTLSSAMGVGADTGLGGTLNVGTAYCIIEERQNGVTFPVQPEVCGWQQVAPGETYVAAMQIRYASPFWETSSIDGGNQDTDTSYEDGGSRIDIFALPVLPSVVTPVPNATMVPAGFSAVGTVTTSGFDSIL